MIVAAHVVVCSVRYRRYKILAVGLHKVAVASNGGGWLGVQGRHQWQESLSFHLLKHHCAFVTPSSPAATVPQCSAIAFWTSHRLYEYLANFRRKQKCLRTDKKEVGHQLHYGCGFYSQNSKDLLYLIQSREQ
jgi:hypothetical protein